MRSVSNEAHLPSARALLLLWLAGNSLRLTILAVPPILPTLHRVLHLSESEVGALSNMPTLVLAAGAISGSLLISKIGARRALVAGLAVVAVAGVARSVGPSAPILFGATFVMGLGVAISQPALPSLVRAWLPHRIATGTAVYSNGFLVGEILAAALTAPALVLLLGNWQAALAFWSIPVALTAVAVASLTRELPEEHEAVPQNWWPNWHDATTWRLGLVLGCASAAYFGCNAFLPDYLRATGHGDLIPAALTALNVGQLPASFLVATFSSSVIGARWPLSLAGVLMGVAVCGFLLGGVWVVVWAAVMGLGSALVFVLALALPPTLADAGDVHRLTAAMFTISYTLPFVASTAGGALWDVSGVPPLGFAPVFVAALLLFGLVPQLRVHPAIRT